MNPIETRESNFVYLGPTPEVADLPCRIEQDLSTFSVWQFTDEERRQIAGGANLRLGIYGVRPIPPVSLQVVPDGGPWMRVQAGCSVCGKLVEDPIHQSGTGTHAFRCPSLTRAQVLPERDNGGPRS